MLLLGASSPRRHPRAFRSTQSTSKLLLPTGGNTVNIKVECSLWSHLNPASQSLSVIFMSGSIGESQSSHWIAVSRPSWPPTALFCSVEYGKTRRNWRSLAPKLHPSARGRCIGWSPTPLSLGEGAILWRNATSKSSRFGWLKRRPRPLGAPGRAMFPHKTVGYVFTFVC